MKLTPVIPFLIAFLPLCLATLEGGNAARAHALSRHRRMANPDSVNTPQFTCACPPTPDRVPARNDKAVRRDTPPPNAIEAVQAGACSGVPPQQAEQGMQRRTNNPDVDNVQGPAPGSIEPPPSTSTCLCGAGPPPIQYTPDAVAPQPSFVTIRSTTVQYVTVQSQPLPPRVETVVNTVHLTSAIHVTPDPMHTLIETHRITNIVQPTPPPPASPSATPSKVIQISLQIAPGILVKAKDLDLDMKEVPKMQVTVNYPALRKDRKEIELEATWKADEVDPDAPETGAVCKLSLDGEKEQQESVTFTLSQDDLSDQHHGGVKLACKKREPLLTTRVTTRAVTTYETTKPVATYTTTSYIHHLYTSTLMDDKGEITSTVTGKKGQDATTMTVTSSKVEKVESSTVETIMTQLSVETLT